MNFKNILKSEFARIKQEVIYEQFIGFDLKMQKGYQYLSNQEYNKVIEIWISVWNELMDYMKKNNMKTFKMFDQVYNGTQFVSNWVNDFEDCLYNIVANSTNPEALKVYGNLRISLNEQIQIFTVSEDQLTMENAKRAIAETYFLLGDFGKGEELFQGYLSESPKWGWGWIRWSDQYWLFKGKVANYVKGEELLLKALAVPDLDDRDCVEDRLLELYSESGQDEKLKRLEDKLN